LYTNRRIRKRVKFGERTKTKVLRRGHPPRGLRFRGLVGKLGVSIFRTNTRETILYVVVKYSYTYTYPCIRSSYRFSYSDGNNNGALKTITPSRIVVNVISGTETIRGTTAGVSATLRRRPFGFSAVTLLPGNWLRSPKWPSLRRYTIIARPTFVYVRPFVGRHLLTRPRLFVTRLRCILANQISSASFTVV